MDFTLKKLYELLIAFQRGSYIYISYSDFVNNSSSIGKDDKIIILRHDTEKSYLNALKIAFIENSLGIKGSYYFRISTQKNLKVFIKKIADLGHEIGYHYDDFSTSGGNVNEAISRFLNNLAYLKNFGTIQTITMEGAPLSKYDNKKLWEIPLTHELIDYILSDPSITSDIKMLFYENLRLYSSDTFHYRLFNIAAEPYFDLDFDNFFYITDTGRCWNGFKYSVRDKIPQYKEWLQKGHSYRSTNDIIKAVNEHKFPRKAMITIHPQRWHDKPLPWIRELLAQNIKNRAKYLLIRFRES